MIFGFTGRKRSGSTIASSADAATWSARVISCSWSASQITSSPNRLRTFRDRFNETPTAAGFQSWIDRAGRFRSLGDGQVDFGGIFSKLTQYGYQGWAVLEWEC